MCKSFGRSPPGSRRGDSCLVTRTDTAGPRVVHCGACAGCNHARSLARPDGEAKLSRRGTVLLAFGPAALPVAPSVGWATLCIAFRPLGTAFIVPAVTAKDQASGMLTWPHSGFHVHTASGPRGRSRVRDAPRAPRYCARIRSRWNGSATTGPRRPRRTARTRRTARRRAPRRWTRSRPRPGCWCTSPTRATSPRGTLAGMPIDRVPCGGRPSPPSPMRRPRSSPHHGWRRRRPPAGGQPLLQQLFEVDPRACPTCRGPMRIIAFITQASVIDQILTHLRTRAAHAAHAGARRPPSTRAPASRGASRAPRPPADAPTVP